MCHTLEIKVKLVCLGNFIGTSGQARKDNSCATIIFANTEHSKGTSNFLTVTIIKTFEGHIWQK